MKERRKLKRIGGAFVATTLVIMSLSLNVFASEPVARANGVNYSDPISAWNAVRKGGTIVMLKDWNLQERLVVETNAQITLEMDGHIIDRGLATTDYSGEGKGQIFFVNDGATLTINGGKATEHRGYVEGGLWFSGAKEGSVTNLTGGVIRGGASDDSDGAGAITMMNRSTVTLNQVSIVGNVSDCFWTFYGDGGAIRMQDEYGTLNLTDSRIMFNHAEDDGGAIYIQKDHCTVNMVRSSVGSNYACDEGGGIYSEGKDTKINMSEHSSISLNQANDGGGIYLNQDKCVLAMRDSEVSYNKATDEGGGICCNDVYTTIRMLGDSHIDSNQADEGGGVHFSERYFHLQSTDMKSTISNNHAEDGDGGGVYIDGTSSSYTDGASIFGITFDNNYASQDGGGVYIGQESVSIGSCRFIRNVADDEGGAIYVDNDKNVLNGCTITYNTAKTAGGGVFSSASVDIGLAGKMTIADNVRSDKTEDDLFLNDAVETSYLNGSPTSTSNVGIRVNKMKERKIGGDTTFFFQDAFFLDESEDYHVEFMEDEGELWIKSGKKTTVSFTEVSPTPTDAGACNGEKLVKGYFSYPSVVDSEADLSGVFYYSDGYFLDGAEGNYGNPDLYNTHLATMSMSMAMAAFYSNLGNADSFETDRHYTYKSQNIERLFTDIGIAPEDIFISDSNTLRPGTNTIGVAIGHKEIGSNGEILVPIAVRGAGYESEWFGNTTVGVSGEHQGFATAADQVFALVRDYITKYGLEEAAASGKIKFWIAGYSRAGATSNLTARRLVEAYCDGTGTSMNNHVYAYCFEAPKGGMNSEMKLTSEKYYCIHNCINKVDLVPLVAPEEMGFIRYGVDHYVPGGKVGAVKTNTNVWSVVKGQPWTKQYMTWYDNEAWSVGSNDYYIQRTKMREQLTSIDPVNIYFYDRFETATIRYGLSYFGYNMISTVDTDLTQEQYVCILMRALQSWGFYECYKGDFRAGYASLSSNGATFQEALQTLTLLFFGKRADDLEGMMNALSGATDRIANTDIEKFSLYYIWDDVIGDWCTLEPDKRTFYAEALWETIIVGVGPDGYAVADFLTEEEKSQLHEVWYTFLDVLLRFVASDYDFDGNEWNKSHAQVKDKDKDFVITDLTENTGKANTIKGQIILGTLVNNSTALAQGHYPEINLAWLRSYDSFFDQEGNKPITIAKQKAPIVKYAISEDGETWEESKNQSEVDCFFKLSTETPGAGCYYRLKADNGSYGDWKPFNQSIQLAGGPEGVVTHTIEITAVYCGVISQPQEVTITIGKA